VHQDRQRSRLRLVVGIAAIVAPALHTASDALEWQQGGFSTVQLWLNYAAFLPMPWLLLGIHAVHREPRLGIPGLVGALLYGAAFVYFSHSTLVALEGRVLNYELLWQQLGGAYTFWGGVMIAGGLSFAWAAWRAAWLPRATVALLAAGLALNMALALLPAPDIAQTLGSTLRNVGLMAMGAALLRR